MNISFKVLIVVFLIFFVSITFATIINIPDDYPTIQQGINATVDSDTILVADGIYAGNLNKNLTWNGIEKHIIVKSENGFENCVIDCESDGRAFNFNQTSQDTTDIIEGFTIMNGLVYFYEHNGGAIYCHSVSPKVQNNKLFDNVASDGAGGGIYIKFGSPIVRDNVIISNNAECGGGIYCSSSSAIIENNLIDGNAAAVLIWLDTSKGGGLYISGGSPLVKDNIIQNNIAFNDDIEGGAMGGGIYIFGSEALIKNNLIIENLVVIFGGYGAGSGIANQSYLSDTLHCVIECNTIANNLGSGLFSLNATIMNNIIYANSNSGISYYPQSNNGIICNNNVYGNEPDFNNCPPGIGDTSWGFNINGTACDSCFNISEVPLFVSNQDEDFFLSQLEAGQSEQSPCVDAGSGVPVDYGLENYTTRTDSIADIAIVDIGYHYPNGIVITNIENVEFQPKLYQLFNYPNPFKTSGAGRSPATTISFQLSENGEVNLSIYNIKGQKIKTIVNEKLEQGLHQIIWDGKNDNNQYVASGVYFYKLKVNNKNIAIKKYLLLK
ncbi:MAG: right-handed parallel beta-helix repeat-containing protein [Candidatus Cloacimonetes bacterium]|nr:right-handed parallel beta-helix repeat-containing protein [Candidatus Cloacimonadota bacterium]